jgi:hypothetical protein
MPPDPPSAKAPQPVPPAIDDAILRALAKSPNDRFPSATAFAAALRQLAASLVVDEQTDGETLHYAGLKAVTPPNAVAPAAVAGGAAEVSVTAPLPVNEHAAQLSSAAKIRSELEKETPPAAPPPTKPHMDDMTLPTPIRLQNQSKEVLPFGKERAQEYPRAAVDDDQIRRLALAAPPEDTWLGAMKSRKNIPLIVMSMVLVLLVVFIGVRLMRGEPPTAPIRVPAPARE